MILTVTKAGEDQRVSQVNRKNKRTAHIDCGIQYLTEAEKRVRPCVHHSVFSQLKTQGAHLKHASKPPELKNPSRISTEYCSAPRWGIMGEIFHVNKEPLLILLQTTTQD